MVDNYNRRIFIRRLSSAGVCSFAAIGLIGCRHDISSQTDPAEDEPFSSGAHEVKMIGSGDVFVFEPDRLVIEPGETVRFVVESSGQTAPDYQPAARGWWGLL